MNRDREILRTYNRIWDAPFKIYSIDKMRLIVPISPWDAIYYLFGVLIMLLLDCVYPGNIIFVYKFIIAPVLLRFLLVKFKLDGKKPHSFFLGMIIYFITNRRKEYFRPIRTPVLKTFQNKKKCSKSPKRGVKK
jgi:hypothetical protein